MTYELQLDDAVIYPNPYLTITPYGYFKHYFAGTERVATVRGNIHLHEWIDAPLTAPTQREHYIKNQQKIDKNTDDPNYGNKEEKRVITGGEQTTAIKLGKIRKGEVTRNNHNGSLYETLSPISTEDKWSFTPSED